MINKTYHEARTVARIDDHGDACALYLDNYFVGHAVDLPGAAKLLVEYLGLLRDEGLLPSLHEIIWEQQEVSELLNQSNTSSPDTISLSHP